MRRIKAWLYPIASQALFLCALVAVAEASQAHPEEYFKPIYIYGPHFPRQGLAIPKGAAMSIWNELHRIHSGHPKAFETLLALESKTETHHKTRHGYEFHDPHSRSQISDHKRFNLHEAVSRLPELEIRQVLLSAKTLFTPEGFLRPFAKDLIQAATSKITFVGPGHEFEGVTPFTIQNANRLAEGLSFAESADLKLFNPLKKGWIIPKSGKIEQRPGFNPPDSEKIESCNGLLGIWQLAP